MPIPSAASPRPAPSLLAERLEQYRALYADYDAAAPWLRNHRGHLMKLREEEAAIVDGEVTRMLAFVGTAEELRARVASIEAAGYSQLTVQVVEGQFDAIEDWAEVFGLR